MQLLAQLGNMYINGPRLAEIILSPSEIQQLFPAQSQVLVADERREQLKLPAGQLNRFAIYRCGALIQINARAAEHINAVMLGGAA